MWNVSDWPCLKVDSTREDNQNETLTDLTQTEIRNSTERPVRHDEWIILDIGQV